jgi:cell division protein ZapE
MTNLLKEYSTLLEKNQYTFDPAQKELILHLQQVLNDISHHPRSIKSLYQAIFKKKGTGRERDTNGLYIHGNVGQGKSMLMNLFYQNLSVPTKKLYHFHAFMQMVHQEFHSWQQTHKADTHQDSTEWLADKLAAQYTIICLDELYITEIGDAMIISRLLSLLMEKGLFLVITSNRAPDDLYLDGVAKFNFVEFIRLLKTHTTIYNLAAKQDYRFSKHQDQHAHYFFPLGNEANSFIENWRKELLADKKTAPITLPVQERTISFNESVDGILFTSFEEICVANYGPADYLEIASAFDTVVITDIPQLSPQQRNHAKRFTLLIDQLYEHKVRLICTCAVAPANLYQSGDESFEFARTVSRLVEMQGIEYLNQHK